VVKISSVNQDEYYQAKQGLLAADLSGQAKWKLTGSDRIRYLNGQSTCDVTRLSPGKSTWGAITNIKGKLEGDLRISATNDYLLVDTNSDIAESLFKRLSKYLIADDAELSDVSADWKLYHLLGTEAVPLELQSVPELLGFPSNRFGQPGLDLWIPAGYSHTPACAGTSVWECLRIENAVPRWGVDMDSSHLAPEMPFERLGGLSYNKGCYIGQEVIARIKSIGRVNKQLCLLHANESVEPGLPCPCVSGGKIIGTATSCALSPAKGGSFVIATLARQYVVPGTIVEIADRPFVVI